MAKLNRTQSLGTTVTRQHLYDLISTCGFTDLGITLAGVGNIVAASAAPTTFTASTWWWDMTNQLLKVPVCCVEGSACSIWLAVGPDSWETPVYNPGPNALPFGMLVSFKTGAAGIYDVEPTVPQAAFTSTFSYRVENLRMDRNVRNTLGHLQATLAAGEWGRAVYRGLGYGLHYDAFTSGNGNNAYPVVLSTAVTGTCQTQFSSYGIETPYTYAILLCRPPTTFVAAVPMPLFIWLPYNNCSASAS